MAQVSTMYADLPVTLTDAEFEELTGTNIKEALGATSDAEVRKLLNGAHQAVYYDLIYSGYGKEFKDKLITDNLIMLRNVLKMSLAVQIEYMLDAGGGSYAGADLSSKAPDGTVTLVSNEKTREKIVAPGVVTLLERATPNLLLDVNVEG